MALEAFDEIPPELVHTDWLQTVLQEAQRLGEVIHEHWNVQSQAASRRHEESKPVKEFIEGELVLVARPFYEKGTGVILPQADGP
jgi:hypothetical protein